jgi:hypothetical protein
MESQWMGGVGGRYGGGGGDWGQEKGNLIDNIGTSRGKYLGWKVRRKRDEENITIMTQEFSE